MTVRSVDDPGLSDRQAVPLRHVFDFCGRADENGDDQTFGAGLERRGEGGGLAGMGHSRRDGLEVSATQEQLFVFPGSMLSVHDVHPMQP
jgi:hypothetical protein